jgi:hypothetical protein
MFGMQYFFIFYVWQVKAMEPNLGILKFKQFIGAKNCARSTVERIRSVVA